ncbi:MAG: DUF389 domain-containing protein [Clostridia bacterium]|nr:DUF389 domain-containing protein [Clostridia bacterium]
MHNKIKKSAKPVNTSSVPPREVLSIKMLFKQIFSIEEDTATPEQVRERILDGGKVTGTNMALLVLAILIASIGLNTNSVAVIIGAMLVSPIMGSILAIAYGTVTANPRTVEIHFTGFILQVVISIGTSALFFWLSPVKEPTSELLARTNPSFFDVVLATVGGLAGIIGQTRKDKANNVIPGVAIATALMPPLCTCGYSIANSKWDMLSGAAYLFIINSYFIYNSSELILATMQLPKIRELTESERKKARRRKIRTTIFVMIPSIITLVLLYLDR